MIRADVAQTFQRYAVVSLRKRYSPLLSNSIGFSCACCRRRLDLEHRRARQPPDPPGRSRGRCRGVMWWFIKIATVTNILTSSPLRPVLPSSRPTYSWVPRHLLLLHLDVEEEAVEPGPGHHHHHRPEILHYRRQLPS